MLNQIVLMGRLTRDPELRRTGSGVAVASFTLAVDRDLAVVTGRLQIRNWTDKEGNKRRSAEVVADNVYFGDSKRDGAAPGGFDQTPPYPQAPAYQAPASPAPSASGFSMLEDDDSELPF